MIKKMNLILLFIGIATAFIIFSCKNSSEKIIDSIAKSYGYDDFKNIEQIKFTFNITRNGKEGHRQWLWDMKNDTVTYNGDDGSGKKKINLQYSRNKLNEGNAELNLKVDKMFINDRYWLLYPFYLKIDENMFKATVFENQPLPINKGTATKLLIEYPNTGGYTPGDAYEFYVGSDYFIKEWIHHKGGAAVTPDVTATWENNTKFGPITLSLLHNGNNGNFKLAFTDVSVKFTNQNDWIK